MVSCSITNLSASEPKEGQGWAVLFAADCALVIPPLATLADTSCLIVGVGPRARKTVPIYQAHLGRLVSQGQRLVATLRQKKGQLADHMV